MEQDEQASQRGRPTKPKKDSTLTMRITRATRDALERAAAEQGRSVSEVAERWLDEASRGKASFVQLLGGLSVAPAIECMAHFARELEGMEGPPESSAQARAALVEGLIHLTRLVVPWNKLGEDDLAFAKVRAPLSRSCEALHEALSRWALEEELAGKERPILASTDTFTLLRNCSEGPGLVVSETTAALGDLLTKLAGAEDLQVRTLASEGLQQFEPFALALNLRIGRLAEAGLRGRDLAEAMTRSVVEQELVTRMLDAERYGVSARLAVPLERRSIEELGRRRG